MKSLADKWDGDFEFSYITILQSVPVAEGGVVLGV